MNPKTTLAALWDWLEPRILFGVCGYESVALGDPTDTIPTITSKVDPLPWPGRFAVWAGFTAYLAFHFHVVDPIISWLRRWWR